MCSNVAFQFANMATSQANVAIPSATAIRNQPPILDFLDFYLVPMRGTLHNDGILEHLLLLGFADDF